MAEITRLRDVSPSPADDEVFEKLKTLLSEGSKRRKLIKLLDDRLATTTECLLVAYKQPVGEGYQHQVEAKHAVNAMALQPLVSQEPHDSHTVPSWMSFAKARLAESIMQDPVDRGALKSSVFFASAHEQQRFAIHVSAGIQPYGDYDDISFAVAAATGELDTLF